MLKTGIRLLLRKFPLGRGLSLMVVAGSVAWWVAPKVIEKKKPAWPRSEVARILGDDFRSSRYPASVSLPVPEIPEAQPFKVDYTIDFELQGKMEQLFQSYKPDYGAFVAVDADTGRVLSLISFSRHPNNYGHLALQARFPAASIFKIVTASAALDSRLLQPDSVIPFDGAPHTLYRKNVNKTHFNRWTRYVTLQQAFAKSINTVFGKIGAFQVGSGLLDSYAKRFGFNGVMDTDMPAESGRVNVPKDDPWGVAEVASGFTHESRLSPLHGALIGAAAANDGLLMTPYVVERFTNAAGLPVYEGAPIAGTRVLSPEGAASLRELMQATVENGTSRKSFRRLRGLRRIDELEVGGKTGSLMAKGEPRGKVDWFVGYARIPSADPKRPEGIRIGLAALTVNVKQWTVKSSWLAGRFVELYHQRMPALQQLADQREAARVPAAARPGG